jgi:hypothetical protein
VRFNNGFERNADGLIYAVTVQPDGKILMGSPLTHIGDLASTNLARLNANTSLADSFSPATPGLS